MPGPAKRPGTVFVLLVLALSPVACLWPNTAEGGAARVGRRPRVIVTAQPDGALSIAGRSYRALIGTDGNLHSFRVGEVEMLDDRVAISLGSFFYADGPRRLAIVTRQGESGIRASDGTYAISYRFNPDEIRARLENRGARAIPYFVVLSPAVTVVTRPGSEEAAAVPANESWGAVRFGASNGAFLELRGGSRIWGPWLGRQVWEVSRVPAGGKQEIVFRAGVGPPPRAAPEQLVGISAATPSDTGLVPAGKPLEVVVSLQNRSERALRGSLAVELAASRGDVVIYSTAPVEVPPQRVTERSFHWQVSAPDFYGAKVTATLGGREVRAARAEVGYRASEILPHVPRPADFEQFWQRLLDKVGKTPPLYRLRRDDRLSRRGVDVWVVRYQGLAGKTIHGWYAAPAGAHGRPAILYLSGYGARPIEPPTGLASHGWAVLAIDVRGNRVDRARPRSFEDYCTRGIESPDTYVYREIVGHALLGLSLLRSRPEADPGRIAVIGVSEGGGLGLMLSALSPTVAALAADAPLLVDFPLSLRAAAWPYAEIARYAQEKPIPRDRLEQTLSYFDAVNFAPAVHCPVLLSIGLLDRVSLPAAVFGLYNVLPEPKEIRPFPRAGHEVGGEDQWAYKLDWLSRMLKAGTPP